jgi:hypothetical protein
MTGRAPVGRDQVLGGLKRALEPLPFVHAIWEGGAVGYGRLDEWSDIDLYILVDDDSVKEAFAATDRALESVSPIAIKYDIGQTPHDGVHQAFYRLRDTSEFLLVDLAVVTMGAPDKFLEPETHGEPRFLFRKAADIPVPALDMGALAGKVRGRAERLRLRMDMFHVFVQKEINRGHLIEAVDAYRVIVLGSLTELLRIRHHPVHHEFQTRYLYSELPPGVVSRLEDLYMVADMADLSRKYASALEWFGELYVEMRGKGP